MDHIVEPNENFDFSQLSLAPPTGIQGGSYFTKLFNNKNPLYIQIPKCQTKQGIVQSGRKMYYDLKFTQNDAEFIQWLENLETSIQDLIFTKSKAWFHDNITKDDIESAFTSPIKIFKTGKFYLVRCNLPFNHLTSTPNVKIFNENEEPLSYKDINADTSLISILEISGVRFTTKNFQIDINVKQIMVLNDEPVFTNCLIKRSSMEPSNHKQSDLVEVSNEPDIEITNTLEEVEISNNSIDVNKKLPDNDELSTEQETNLISDISSVSLDITTKCDDNVNMEDKKNEEVGENILATSEINDDANSEVNDDESDIESDVESNISSEIYDLPKPKITITKEPVLLSDMLDTSVDDYINGNKNNHESLDNSENKTNKNLDIQEVDINLAESSTNNIKLKSHDEVYYELYHAARSKAKLARKAAIEAYLEAKNIKNLYMLDEIESDEDDEFNEILEPTENSSSLA